MFFVICLPIFQAFVLCCFFGFLRLPRRERVDRLMCYARRWLSPIHSIGHNIRMVVIQLVWIGGQTSVWGVLNFGLCYGLMESLFARLGRRKVLKKARHLKSAKEVQDVKSYPKCTAGLDGRLRYSHAMKQWGGEGLKC
jgi:hypothetical protein